jgi:hypothetical protein
MHSALLVKLARPLSAIGAWSVDQKELSNGFDVISLAKIIDLATTSGNDEDVISTKKTMLDLRVYAVLSIDRLPDRNHLRFTDPS